MAYDINLVVAPASCQSEACQQGGHIDAGRQNIFSFVCTTAQNIMNPHQEALNVAMLQQQQLLQVQAAIQLLRRRRRRRPRDRRMWVRQWILRRPGQGIYHNLMLELRNEDPSSFINFLRMPPEMYDELCHRLAGRLTKQATNWRQPLEPGLKLALTLRHLASGATYKDMSYGWRVPPNTMSKVVREVCTAILAEFTDEMLTLPNTEEGWRALATQWYETWQFPNTIGAIDGKHVAIRAPLNSGSEYYNYKGFFSIILFAMVSADYKFTYLDVSANGSSSDARIYNHSDLRAGLHANDINGWPPPQTLPNDENGEKVPYFIVGDDAFALRTYLMKPYGSRNLTKEERIFNYRLSRARRVVENSFGILANRFRVLLTTMCHEPDTVRLIVSTCCVLHNLMRTRYPTLQNRLLDRDGPNQEVIPGEWREGRNLEDTQYRNVQGPNRASREGKAQRNLLKHWCNSPVGSVSWQERTVMLTNHLPRQ
jgi:hypothetical protein